MLVKKMTYKDYMGVERTEDFYFNLSKAEVTEMEMGTNGGMRRMLEQIVAEQDSKRIVETFKDIILRSYGQMSNDGKFFDKSPELSKRFSHTEAYSDLFMELATNAEKAAAFINGILPQIPKDNQTPTNAATPAAMPVLATIE